MWGGLGGGASRCWDTEEACRIGGLLREQVLGTGECGRFPEDLLCSGPELGLGRQAAATQTDSCSHLRGNFILVEETERKIIHKGDKCREKSREEDGDGRGYNLEYGDQGRP